MKHSFSSLALTLVATWSMTGSAEPLPAPPQASKAAPKAAPKASVMATATAAPMKLSGALKGTAPLNAAAKLAVAQNLAGRLNLAAPTGIEQPVRLSARHPYEAGKADISASCVTRFDPVADVIAPSIYQLPLRGFGLGLPQIPKPHCELAGTQFIKIRVHPSRAGQAIMFDIVVELEPSAYPGLRAKAEIEVYNPLTPGAHQTWELTEGEAGHLTGIMMPPGLEWASLELRVLKGSVLVRSVELSQLR